MHGSSVLIAIGTCRANRHVTCAGMGEQAGCQFRAFACGNASGILSWCAHVRMLYVLTCSPNNHSKLQRNITHTRGRQELGKPKDSGLKAFIMKA